MLKKKICLFLLTTIVINCCVGCGNVSSRNNLAKVNSSSAAEYTVKRDDISVDLSLSGSVKSSRATTVTGGNGNCQINVCIFK